MFTLLQIDDAYDVRVLVDPGHEPGFFLEAIHPLFILGELGMHDLDGNVAAKIRVQGPIDATEATLTDQLRLYVLSYAVRCGHGLSDGDSYFRLKTNLHALRPSDSLGCMSSVS
jgi:hypothetical protein